MLSRVANSIYWMARNCERAENLARFIEVTINYGLDQPEDGIDHWEPLVRATGDQEYFEKHYDQPSLPSVCRFLTFDSKYHSSIKVCITNARENARTVREAIASEAWEQLNSLYHFVKSASKDPQFIPDAEFYDDIVQHCYMLTGVLSATMTRGEGWHFYNVGRLLERADKTSRILDVKYFTLLRHVREIDTTIDDLLWSAVLRSACGFEMFRKRHHALTVKRIVDFLVFDEEFPRSIYYSVQEALESLHRIPGPDGMLNSAIERTDALLNRLRETDAQQLIDHGLHEFTDSIQLTLNEIGDEIQRTYFELRSFSAQSQQQ